MLQIYNSLTNQKQPFTPIEPNKVSMYVCGMTVYDYCHLGHARVMVVFDMIYRHLMASGYDVTYVRNITDIDDKIIARANENGEAFQALTERFIQAMHEDEEALGILTPNIEPRATDSMDKILSMIQTLVDKGYAYQANNNDVYFKVTAFEGYGKLSGRNIDDLRAGERVNIDEAKHDPLDFVLWKSAKPDEPYWDSPWGKGRPGWHIECSAMSTHHLGNQFDIHGGGHDLQFPHHENEIAQSEACTGHNYANYWIHNGFIRINEEKMSKSLGNFFTIREVLKHYKAEAIRYFMLSSHYRSPLNYSTESLDNAHSALNRLYTALRGLDLSTNSVDQESSNNLNHYIEQFNAAMDDDFNTSEALSVLFELVRDINRFKQEEKNKDAINSAQILLTLANQLGLLQDDIESWFKGDNNNDQSLISDEAINTLIEQRLAARNNKDWALADTIRDQLKAANIILEDGGSDCTWRRG